MDELLEFQGRLTGPEGAAGETRRTDLRVRLHETATGEDPLWEETLRGVFVGPDGAFHVVLGQVRPLPGDLFQRFPRWLAVHDLKAPDPEAEQGPRVPLLGTTLRLARRVAALEARGPRAAAPDGEARRDLERQASHLRRLRDGYDHLQSRVSALEEQAEAGHLRAAVGALTGRLDALEGEGGRLERVEDEIEDLVGSDGDVVDLGERLDRLEAAVAALRALVRRG